jgi:hypothetical protein
LLFSFLFLFFLLSERCPRATRYSALRSREALGENRCHRRDWCLANVGLLFGGIAFFLNSPLNPLKAKPRRHCHQNACGWQRH